MSVSHSKSFLANGVHINLQHISHNLRNTVAFINIPSLYMRVRLSLICVQAQFHSFRNYDKDDDDSAVVAAAAASPHDITLP